MLHFQSRYLKENTVFNLNSMFKLAENDKIWQYDVALYCMTFTYIMRAPNH